MAAPSKNGPVSVEARCVRLPAKADDPASLAPFVERHTLSRAASELLIEVKAAAVNPSDIKAATGLIAYAVFPRTPGRDYAGIVIDGPAGWIGRDVIVPAPMLSFPGLALARAINSLAVAGPSLRTTNSDIFLVSSVTGTKSLAGWYGKLPVSRGFMTMVVSIAASSV